MQNENKTNWKSNASNFEMKSKSPKEKGYLQL